MPPTRQLDVSDLFRLADQFHDSALLHFAHNSGLFEHTTTPQSVSTLSEKMGWPARKTQIFGNALAAIGLLIKHDDGQFENAPVANDRLVKGREGYMGGVVEHQRLQWDAWARLGEVLEATATLPWQQEARLARDEDANRAFHEAMRNLARANVPAFVALPQVGPEAHVLDLAGGHGMYLAALAQKHPKLTGEVWDRPGARELAHATFEEFGCADRCEFHERNILEPEHFEGKTADVVMLNDCLHYWTPQVVSGVIARSASMVRSNGTMLIATRVLHESGVTPEEAAGFSMHMMLNTADGGLHPTPWISAEMESHGFKVERAPLDPLGRYTILVGTRGA